MSGLHILVRIRRGGKSCKIHPAVVDNHVSAQHSSVGGLRRPRASKVYEHTRLDLPIYIGREVDQQ